MKGESFKVVLPSKMLQWLRDESERRGLSVAAVIRDLVARAMGRKA